MPNRNARDSLHTAFRNTSGLPGQARRVKSRLSPTPGSFKHIEMKNRILRPACGLALAFLCALTGARGAFAQSNYATLGGTVYDPQRQAVPGAAVRSRRMATR